MERFVTILMDLAVAVVHLDGVEHFVCITIYFIPRFAGVYCFQHVRDSVISKFRQHLMILLYNCDSFCPILFKFTSHHNHQTMHA